MRRGVRSGGHGIAAHFIRQSKTSSIKAMTELDARGKKLRGAIMAACAKLGMDEDTRRDLFERVSGKRSLREIHPNDLAKILDEINATKNPIRHSAKVIQNKIYALWMSAYWLGQIDHTDKSALDAFVKRQTGCEKFIWLKPWQAAQVIEALKAMCERAGVAWINGGTSIHPACAVAEALAFNLLVARLLTEVKVSTDPDIAQYNISKLGARWRAHLGK